MQGSLLVAILNGLLFLIASAGNSDRPTPLLDRLLGTLHRLLKFYNRYAYTYVAVYGEDFSTSSSKVWGMFQASGWDALINDELTGAALSIGMVVAGVLGMIISFLVNALFDLCGLWCSLYSLLISILTAMLIASAVLGNVQAAISTTFVLWAEDPKVLQSNRPEFYEKMRAAAVLKYPSMVKSL